MAFFSDTASLQARPTFFAAFAAKVVGVFAHMMEAQDRTPAVQKLNALSDRELADIGIRREDIVRHVFRYTYYG